MIPTPTRLQTAWRRNSSRKTAGSTRRGSKRASNRVGPTTRDYIVSITSRVSKKAKEEEEKKDKEKTSTYCYSSRGGSSGLPIHMHTPTYLPSYLPTHDHTQQKIPPTSERKTDETNNSNIENEVFRRPAAFSPNPADLPIIIQKNYLHPPTPRTKQSHADRRHDLNEWRSNFFFGEAQRCCQRRTQPSRGVIQMTSTRVKSPSQIPAANPFLHRLLSWASLPESKSFLTGRRRGFCHSLPSVCPFLSRLHFIERSAKIPSACFGRLTLEIHFGAKTNVLEP